MNIELDLITATGMILLITTIWGFSGHLGDKVIEKKIEQHCVQGELQ